MCINEAIEAALLNGKQCRLLQQLVCLVLVSILEESAGSIRRHLLALLLDAEGHRQRRQQKAHAATERLRAADNLCHEIRHLIVSNQHQAVEGTGTFRLKEIDDKIKTAITVNHNPLYDSESTFNDPELD